MWSLIEQLDLNDLNLLDVEQKAVIEVIRRRQATFSLSKRDLGKTNVLTHIIDIGDAAPIRQHPRNMSEEKKTKGSLDIKKICQMITLLVTYSCLGLGQLCWYIQL